MGKRNTMKALNKLINAEYWVFEIEYSDHVDRTCQISSQRYHQAMMFWCKFWVVGQDIKSLELNQLRYFVKF